MAISLWCDRNEAAPARRQRQFLPHNGARRRGPAAAVAEEEAATSRYASRCRVCSPAARGPLPAGVYAHQTAEPLAWQTRPVQQKRRAAATHLGLHASPGDCSPLPSEHQQQQRGRALPFGRAGGLRHREGRYGRQGGGGTTTAEEQQLLAYRTRELFAQASADAAATKGSNSPPRDRCSECDALAALRAAQRQARPSSSSSSRATRPKAHAVAAASATPPDTVAAEATAARAARKRSAAPAIAAAGARAASVDEPAPWRRETPRERAAAARERMRVTDGENRGYMRTQATYVPVLRAGSVDSAGRNSAGREFYQLLQERSGRPGVDSVPVLRQSLVSQLEPHQQTAAYAHAHRAPQQHRSQQRHRPQQQEEVRRNGEVKEVNRGVEELLQALVQNQPLPPLKFRREVLAFSEGTAALKLDLESIFAGLHEGAEKRTSRPPLQPKSLQTSPYSATVCFSQPPFNLASLKSSFAPASDLVHHRQEEEKQLQQQQKLQNREQLQSQQQPQNHQQAQQHQQHQQRMHSAEEEEEEKQHQRHRGCAECDSRTHAARVALRRENADVRLGVAAPASSAQSSFACARTADVTVASRVAVAGRSLPPAAPHNSSSLHTLFSPFYIHCPYTYKRAAPCSAISAVPTSDARAGALAAGTSGVAAEAAAATSDGGAAGTSPLTATPTTGEPCVCRKGGPALTAGRAAVFVRRDLQAALRDRKAANYNLGSLEQRLPISYESKPSAAQEAAVSSPESETEEQEQRQRRWISLQQREHTDKLQQQSQQQKRNVLEEKGQQQEQCALLLKNMDTSNASSIPDGVASRGRSSQAGSPHAPLFILDEQSTTASLECVPLRGQRSVRSRLLPQTTPFGRGSPIPAAAETSAEAAENRAAPAPGGGPTQSRSPRSAGPPQNAETWAEDIAWGSDTAAAAFPSWSVWQSAGALIAEELDEWNHFSKALHTSIFPFFRKQLLSVSQNAVHDILDCCSATLFLFGLAQLQRRQERLQGGTHFWPTERTALLQLQLRVRSYKAGQQELRAILRGASARIRRVEEEQQQKQHQWALLMCRRDSEVQLLRQEKDALQQELRAQVERSKAETDRLTEQLTSQQQQLEGLQQHVMQQHQNVSAKVGPHVNEHQRLAVEKRLRQELAKQLRAEIEEQMRQEAERQVVQRPADQQLRSSVEQKLREEAKNLQESLREMQAKEQHLQEELRLQQRRLVTELDESEKNRQQVVRAWQEAQEECAQQKKLIETLQQGQSQAARQQSVFEELRTTEQKLQEVSRQLSGEKLQRKQVNAEVQELKRELSGERKQRRQLEDELHAVLETQFGASNEGERARSAEERERRCQSLRKRHQLLQYQRLAQDAALFKATLEAHRVGIAPHVLQYDQAVQSERDKHGADARSNAVRPGRRIGLAGEELLLRGGQPEDGKFLQSAADAEEAERRATVHGGQVSRVQHAPKAQPARYSLAAQPTWARRISESASVTREKPVSGNRGDCASVILKTDTAVSISGPDRLAAVTVAGPAAHSKNNALEAEASAASRPNAALSQVFYRDISSKSSRHDEETTIAAAAAANTAAAATVAPRLRGAWGSVTAAKTPAVRTDSPAAGDKAASIDGVHPVKAATVSKAAGSEVATSEEASAGVRSSAKVGVGAAPGVSVLQSGNEVRSVPVCVTGTAAIAPQAPSLHKGGAKTKQKPPPLEKRPLSTAESSFLAKEALTPKHGRPLVRHLEHSVVPSEPSIDKKESTSAAVKKTIPKLPLPPLARFDAAASRSADRDECAEGEIACEPRPVRSKGVAKRFCNIEKDTTTAADVDSVTGAGPEKSTVQGKESLFAENKGADTGAETAAQSRPNNGEGHLRTQEVIESRGVEGHEGPKVVVEKLPCKEPARSERGVGPRKQEVPKTADGTGDVRNEQPERAAVSAPTARTTSRPKEVHQSTETRGEGTGGHAEAAEVPCVTEDRVDGLKHVSGASTRHFAAATKAHSPHKHPPPRVEVLASTKAAALQTTANEHPVQVNGEYVGPDTQKASPADREKQSGAGGISGRSTAARSKKDSAELTNPLKKVPLTAEEQKRGSLVEFQGQETTAQQQSSRLHRSAAVASHEDNRRRHGEDASSTTGASVQGGNGDTLDSALSDSSKEVEESGDAGIKEMMPSETGRAKEAP